MPPFCAPVPPDLLPDTAAQGPERGDDRAEVIALLVDALNVAEASAAPGVDENSEDLANQAYASLCYDFPNVPTRALGALHSALKSSFLETGKPLFPVTRKFIAGLCYLLGSETRRKVAAEGSQRGDDGRVELDRQEVEIRNVYLTSLCACVFVLAPAVRLAVAWSDEGKSLFEFFSLYDHRLGVEDRLASHEAGSLLEDALDVANDCRGTDGSAAELEVVGIRTEFDDDDSDWEPLETLTPSAPTLAAFEKVTKEEEVASTSIGSEIGWFEVLEKAVHLTSLVPKEVINSSVWDEMQLTTQVLLALSGLRKLEQENGSFYVTGVAEVFMELLTDHMVFSSRSSAAPAALPSTVSALLRLVEGCKNSKTYSTQEGDTRTEKVKTWSMIVLSSLAKVCSRVGGTSSCADANSGVASRNVIRSLWPAMVSTLTFLQDQLQSSVDTGTYMEAYCVWSILCFLLKHAPGNADLASIVVGKGFLRTSLGVFMKVGGEPGMETLRQFLLVSLATCTAAAEFAAQMPTFRAVLSGPQFVSNNWSRPYASVWLLLLQRSRMPEHGRQAKKAYSKADVESSEYEVGKELIDSMKKVAYLVGYNHDVLRQQSFFGEILGLHRTLQLLIEAVTVGPSGSFKLWSRGGLMDNTIRSCQVALGGLLVQGQSCNDSSDKLNDLVTACKDADESKLKRAPGETRTSEGDILVCKILEILPRTFLQLKQLASFTSGLQGAKID